MHASSSSLLLLLTVLAPLTISADRNIDTTRSRAVYRGNNMVRRQVNSLTTTTTSSTTLTPAQPSTTSSPSTTAVPVSTTRGAQVTSSARITTGGVGTTTSVVESTSEEVQRTGSSTVSSTETAPTDSVNTTSSSFSSSFISSSSASISPSSSSIESSATSPPSSSSTTSASIEQGTTLVQTIVTSVPGSNNVTDASAAAKDTPSSDAGLSTGAIVAIAVVGGVVALALALFVVWKLKRKRFGGYDDDDDAIKWPELDRHGDMSTLHPLPARPTGGHGLETNAMERSETDLDGEPIRALDADDYEYGGYPRQRLNPVTGYYDDVVSTPTVMSYPSDGSSAPYLTLGRNNSIGSGLASSSSQHGGPFSDSATTTPEEDAAAADGGLGRQRSLGGTRALEMDDGRDEMRMLGGLDSVTGVGRSKSGRLL